MESTHKRQRSNSPSSPNTPPTKFAKTSECSPSSTEASNRDSSGAIDVVGEEEEAPVDLPSPVSDASSVTVCSMSSSNMTTIEDLDLREFYKPWTDCYTYEEIEHELQSRRQSWREHLPLETWDYLTDTLNDIRSSEMIGRVDVVEGGIPPDAYNTELVWRERETLKAHREAGCEGDHFVDWYHEW